MTNFEKTQKAAELAADVIGHGLNIYTDDNGQVERISVGLSSKSADNAYPSLFSQPISKLSVKKLADEIIAQIGIR
jgi:hypothetical protein